VTLIPAAQKRPASRPALARISLLARAGRVCIPHEGESGVALWTPDSPSRRSTCARSARRGCYRRV